MQIFILDLNKYVNFGLKGQVSKLESIFSKVLLHYILISKYRLEAQKVNVQKNKNGKLYLMSPYENLFFNVSHSSGLIVIAFSNFENGIDIESVKKNTGLESIEEYDLVFTSEEIKFIKFNQNRIVSFYKVWSLKEAFIKLVGGNLNYMNKFSIFDIISWNVTGLKSFMIKDENSNLYLLSLATLKHFLSFEFQKIDFNELLFYFKFSESCKLFVKPYLSNIDVSVFSS